MRNRGGIKTKWFNLWFFISFLLSISIWALPEKIRTFPFRCTASRGIMVDGVGYANPPRMFFNFRDLSNNMELFSLKALVTPEGYVFAPVGAKMSFLEECKDMSKKPPFPFNYQCIKVYDRRDGSGTKLIRLGFNTDLTDLNVTGQFKLYNYSDEHDQYNEIAKDDPNKDFNYGEEIFEGKFIGCNFSPDYVGMVKGFLARGEFGDLDMLENF